MLFLSSLENLIHQEDSSSVKELLQTTLQWFSKNQVALQANKQIFTFLERYVDRSAWGRLDSLSLVVGMLAECWQISEELQESIQKTFPVEVLRLLELVVSLCEIRPLESYNETQVVNHLAEHIRKLVYVLATDFRSLFIVLVIRVVRLPLNKEILDKNRLKVEARECIEIYASLAERFGLANVKTYLEDKSFGILYPEEYNDIAKYKRLFAKEHTSFLDEIKQEVTQLISNAGIQDFEVKARIKHNYSIYLKSIRYQVSYEKLYDILGMRCILEKEDDIYVVLGLLHHKYRFVEDRFKDYITYPKANGYRSLHSFLYAQSGMGFEIQIRTKEMDYESEYGTASHWSYKTVNNSSFTSVESPFWVQELTENLVAAKDATEIFTLFKKEIFSEFVYAFTPKGKLIKLALGSTVLDFSYAIHSDIGKCTTGAMINGQYKSIRTVLQNGDQIEVLVSKQQKPNANWLLFVKTSRAKSKIKAFLRSENRDIAIREGRAIFQKILIELQIALHTAESSQQMVRLLDDVHCADKEILYQQIAYGRISNKTILRYFDETYAAFPSPKKLFKFKRPNQEQESLIHNVKPLSVNDILELDNMPVRFAQCCKPNKNDTIMGIIGQSRDIVIHVTNCAHVSELQSNKTMIPLTWNDESTNFSLRVNLEVVSLKSASNILKLLEIRGITLKKAVLVQEKKIIKQEIYLLIIDSKVWHSIVEKLNKMKAVIDISITEDIMDS